jgi:hypothetical protein
MAMADLLKALQEVELYRPDLFHLGGYGESASFLFQKKGRI